MLNTLQTAQNQQMVSSLQSQTDNLKQVKSMMNALQSSGNPQGMFNSMLSQNPALRQAQQIASQYSDPKTAFYSTARQKGMTDQQISDFLNALR